MLVHRMTLFSFRLFRKNLGNLREFFGQMVHRPPWQKIARTPMGKSTVRIGSTLRLHRSDQPRSQDSLSRKKGRETWERCNDEISVSGFRDVKRVSVVGEPVG